MPGQFYLSEPSLTSLQIRQANIAELKNNDEYWQNRLKALEANHKKINEVMDAEAQQAVSTILQNVIANLKQKLFQTVIFVGFS